MLQSKKYIIAGLLALGAFGVALWPSRPQRILALAAFHEQRGEEGETNGKRMRDRLIACGPSAIAPIINTIRHHSAWTRRYAYLPQALQGLGEPAHRALLSAIDSEMDISARAYLISALQRAFSDYSRFDRWLADASMEAVSPSQSTHFSGDVRSKFPEAPELAADGRLSVAFTDWWRTNKQGRSNGTRLPSPPPGR